jgi:inward rectifier potassium channel
MEARVTVSALFDEVTPEGQSLRRFYELPLSRSKSPFFRMSWTLYHAINEDSPLHPSKDELGNLRGVLVTMTGHDGTYAQTIYAQKNYAPQDIKKDMYFEDILKELPNGRILIDYDDFHKLKSRPV